MIIIYYIFFDNCNNLETFATKTKPKPKKTYPCKYCKKKFKSKTNLTKHEDNECKYRPYNNKIEKIKSYGGNGGSDFSFTCPSQKTYNDKSNYITKIGGNNGSEVDAIQVYCADGSSSVKYGGTGGGAFTSNEFSEGLSSISVRAGDRIDKIKIQDKEYGGNGGSEYNLSCTEGKIVGIYGKSGSRLDQLGVICDNNIK